MRRKLEIAANSEKQDTSPGPPSSLSSDCVTAVTE